MPYTFLLTGTADQHRIALVRNETEDVTSASEPVEGTDYFLSDTRILAFLQTAREEAPADANEVEVRLMACAACLDVLATNQAFVLKKQRSLADETDGPAVGKEIRVHAANLRTRAANSLKDRRALAAQCEADAEARSRRPHRPSSGGGSIRSVF